MDDFWILEITTKLSGVIFRNALIENSFEKVYKRVLEQILNTKCEDDVHILEILEDVGG
ncbi:MAG: hypothetical protein QMD36_05810 [Candidatus Aenigmarchaeota archaeon]|nr:hypothetical protein [Candidatus Aenigmarchaeota archaeon]